MDSLRRLADASVPHVHDITGLEAARDLRDSTVLVVDRASWAKANTQSFAVMLKPAMEKMLESRRGTISPAAASVSGAITGSQLGAVLAFLSSKVLGQYDPFAALAEGSNAPSGGRLAARGPQHHLRGARAQRHPRGFPALGLPARTDPPRAVRRGALAPPPHAARDRQPQRPPAGQRRLPDGTGRRPPPGP